jgi:hypothetical protein
MDKDLLKKHIDAFVADSRRNPKKFEGDLRERTELTAYYRCFSEERIRRMTPEDIYEYLSRLWAMLIWGNKHYVVDKIIEDNGLERFRQSLATLLWGKVAIASRWDAFRSEVKGMGPAMISEILCKTHPNEFMLWNRRAYVGLNYLGVEGLPRHDYQLTGKVYKHLCDVCQEIAGALRDAGFEDTTLLAVDYLIWDQLQVEDNLSKIHDRTKARTEGKEKRKEIKESKFIHDEVRDKLRDIGKWLGLEAKTEQKVAEGSKVDTIWEATIGNMGRVIYVFEVQTKGSIDGLTLNLLKSLNNSAVQGVVAVSDRNQLETIKRHAQDVKELRDKLKYWDYEEVLRVHEGLAFVNESINRLGLVPRGF